MVSASSRSTIFWALEEGYSDITGRLEFRYLVNMKLLRCDQDALFIVDYSLGIGLFP